MTNLELIMENICEVKVAQFPIAETVENEMVTPKELIKISEEQNSILSKAMDKMDEYRENRDLVKTFDELKDLELKNYAFKFEDGRYIHIYDKYTNYTYACISLGNKKLEQHNKIVTFLIWNVLQICTCPNATEGCLKFCYANKSNSGTKNGNSNSVVSRMRNTVFSMVKNFTEIMLEMLDFAKRNLDTGKDFVLRWHESGDIYDNIYKEKVITIMKNSNMENNLMYTKTVSMLDQINELNESKNITVRYSLDNTTKPRIVAKVIDLNCLTTTVADKNQSYLVADKYDKRFICNLDNKQNIDRIVEEIKDLLIELELETRKTYKRKIQIKINKLSELLVNKDTKCAKCGLKCLSKEIQNIVFMCH